MDYLWSNILEYSGHDDRCTAERVSQCCQLSQSVALLATLSSMLCVIPLSLRRGTNCRFPDFRSFRSVPSPESRVPSPSDCSLRGSWTLDSNSFFFFPIWSYRLCVDVFSNTTHFDNCLFMILFFSREERDSTATANISVGDQNKNSAERYLWFTA